jgi:hypothetical protein
MFAEAQMLYSISTAWNDDPLKSSALLKNNSAYYPNTLIVTKKALGVLFGHPSLEWWKTLNGSVPLKVQSQKGCARGTYMYFNV